MSCPCFCACLRLEMYHTGYLWTPLCSSESTHPPMTYSKDFSEFSERLTPNSEPTCLPSPQTPRTPTRPRLRTLVMASLELLRRTTPIDDSSSPNSKQPLRAISPSLRATTSPNSQSWLPSFGSCFSHASWVWKHRLGLLYVVRHEVIGFFHPTLLLLLVVEFSTTYSLFRLLWLYSYRRFHIYTRPLYTLKQE